MKHDENKDLQSIAKVAQSINRSDKTIVINKNTIVGIRRWGRIDYLRNYCGWFIRIDKSSPVKRNVNLLLQTEQQYDSDINSYKKQIRKNKPNNTKD